MTEETRITVRLPEEVSREIADRASQDRRSLNSEIVWILERWLEGAQALRLDDLFWIRQHGDGNPELAERIARVFGWTFPDVRLQARNRPNDSK
jgi:hypothetical protein